MVVFPFPFHIFMPLANLWVIRLQGQFPFLRIRNFPDLYPLVRPPRRPLSLDKGRILTPGFIRSPPTLAVYDAAHSFPLGGAGRDFPFSEDEIRRHFSTPKRQRCLSSSFLLLPCLCQEECTLISTCIKIKNSMVHEHRTQGLLLIIY